MNILFIFSFLYLVFIIFVLTKPLKTINMLRKITFLAVLAFLSYSCQSNDDFENLNTENFAFSVATHDVTGLSSRDSETACYSTALIAGQHYDAGRIDVEIVTEGKTDYVYITYITNSEWILKLTHLYAGDREGIPETKKGNPKPGVFEKKMDYEANVISDFEVEYKIEASAFDECFALAAHAEVAKIDAKGTIIQRETAWGAGEEFEGGSWAMLFDFCKSQCKETNPGTGDDDPPVVTK
jgi:hypothetical protein